MILATTPWRRALCIPLLLAFAPGCAHRTGAPAPAVELTRPPLDDAARTSVLVLGTIHLRSLGPRYRPALVTSLVDRLATFQPEVIAVEHMAPDAVALVEQQPANAEIAKQYAADVIRCGQAERRQLGFDRVAAAAEAQALLGRRSAWRGQPDEPVQRRRLVALWTAAYEWPSALLQWSYLAAAERHGDGAVAAEVATTLDGWLGRADERVSLALPLARRLGLETIAAVDEHSDEAAAAIDWDAF